MDILKTTNNIITWLFEYCNGKNYNHYILSSVYISNFYFNLLFGYIAKILKIYEKESGNKKKDIYHHSMTKQRLTRNASYLPRCSSSLTMLCKYGVVGVLCFTKNMKEYILPHQFPSLLIWYPNGRKSISLFPFPSFPSIFLHLISKKKKATSMSRQHKIHHHISYNLMILKKI